MGAEFLTYRKRLRQLVQPETAKSLRLASDAFRIVPSGLSDFFAKIEAECSARGTEEQAKRDAVFMASEVATMDFSQKSAVPCAAPGLIGKCREKILSGSQAKTAFALRMNAERMIREGGIDSVAFITLTVGDEVQCWEVGCDGSCDRKKHFRQVWENAEASRRLNNLNRRVLSDLFERAIIVTERHKSGAIHFHILGTLAGRPDIRTGYKFPKFQREASASPALLQIWALLRKKLPKYGFGIAETEPVRKCGKAVSAYVAKYIEKNVQNRPVEDKGKKLVRYLGWNRGHLKSNEFSWGTPGACAWRLKTRAMAGLVGITEREDCAKAFGPRWAHTITNLWVNGFGQDDKPNFEWGWAEKENMRAEMWRLNPAWARKQDGKRIIFAEETADLRAMLRSGWGEHNSDKVFKPLEINNSRDYFAECGILRSWVRKNTFRPAQFDSYTE